MGELWNIVIGFSGIGDGFITCVSMWLSAVASKVFNQSLKKSLSPQNL